MFEITKCYQGNGKNGKPYIIVNYFDVDTGDAGNCIVSPEYLEKLTRGVSEGKTLRQGYDKKNGKNFLYVR